MHRDERGYIVVETIFSFMLFCFLVISILTLINIVTVQTRVHYALTQTANELSMYSYVIDALGMTDDIKALDETGQQVQEQIDSVVSDLDAIRNHMTEMPDSAEELFENLDAVIDAVDSLSQTASSALKDPKETFVDVVRYGLNKGKNYLMQEGVIRPMLEKYLQNGSQDAKTFLKSYGVSGEIDLSDSSYIDSNGDITIVAHYEIDYAFGFLPLPFKTINVTQTAKTKAWLGGVASDG